MSLTKSSINSEQSFTVPNSPSASIYQFEDFRVDASHLMLYKNGTTVLLKPKVVETLIAMLERAGEVISKEELMDRLWHDSFVEETNISQNIYQLRKTLGNSNDGRPFIETFWRRGYRFNGKVDRPDGVALLFATHTKMLVVTEEEIGNGKLKHEDVPPIDDTSMTRTVAGSSSPRLSRTFLLGTIGLIGGLVLMFATIPSIRSSFSNVVLGNNNPASASHEVKLTRLTPDLNIDSSAISPDGRYIAFDLNENGRHSVWVKDVSTGAASQVTPRTDVPYYDLTYSSDGSYIFYNAVQEGYPNRTLFRIAASGGPAQTIARDVVSPVTLSPDQRHLAFVRGVPGEASLVITNSDGSGDEHRLSTRYVTASYESWGSNLSWSPDGSRIAICGTKIVNGKFEYELLEVSVADGEERVIVAPGWDYLDDVQWLSDQSGLVVRGRDTHASPWQIWHVSYPSGEIRRITNDLNDYDGISLSADSRMLVVNRVVGNWNIWLAELDTPNRAKQITSGGTAADGAHGIAFTPDGKIIYTSPRGGNTDLWVMNPDGSDQQQLTKHSGGINRAPAVSRDGRFIAFTSSRSGTKQIWRMDIDGGNPQQLTFSGINDVPLISPDGAWVYFTLLDNEKHRIAKVPITGGDPVIVNHSSSPIFAGAISPQASHMEVGFYDASLPQPWKRGVMLMESGEVLQTFDGYSIPGAWTKDSRSLFIVHDNDQQLWLQPIDGREPRRLTNFEGGRIRSLAISPDFKRIAFARGNPSAEAVIITNF